MTALQMPYAREQAGKVGPRLFRKQVLKVGSIDYKGKRLDFTRDYLAKLAENAGAYDQVPFLLAMPDNSHHNDPEKFRGQVKGYEVTDDGLDAFIELTEDGAKTVADNPRLGVSARIVTDHPTGHAIQHVLGTLDPRVTGMRPWQAVDLSADALSVVDLTAATYEGDPVPDALTGEELAALRALLATATPPKTDEPTKSATDEAPEVDQATLDAELDALVADASAPVGLSDEERAAIELTSARADQTATELSVLREELAEAKFKEERAALIGKGVPPHVVDLAKPLLRGRNTTIELSNSETVDASQIVRDVIVAYHKLGNVDLSTAVGNAASGPDDDGATERAAFTRDYMERFGL